MRAQRKTYCPASLTYCISLLVSMQHVLRAEEPNASSPPAAPVELLAEFRAQSVEVRAPLIAKIGLKNMGSEPLRLKVRPDGAPLQVGFEILEARGDFVEYPLSLWRAGPGGKEIELGPGQTTSGEILVLLDYDRGYVFGSTGLYSVRWYWYPGEQFSRAFSGIAQIRVKAQSEPNKRALSDLQQLALTHYGGDQLPSGGLDSRDMSEALEGWGVKLLAKVIAQDRPLLIAPDQNPQDHKQAELVGSLEELLERHPNSSYSPYIARFLGLVHVKTFEQEISLAEGRSWNEAGKAPEWTTEKLVSEPAHAKALRYLTIAEEADLWPRTTATLHLGRLHVMAQEWEKATATIESVRAQPVTNSGELALELEKAMMAYKSKVEERASRPTSGAPSERP